MNVIQTIISVIKSLYKSFLNNSKSILYKLLEFVFPYLQKFSLITKEKTKDILQKTLGQEKVDQLKEKSIEIKDKSKALLEKTEPFQEKYRETKEKYIGVLNANVDTESKYYGLIKNLWVYSKRLVIGIAIYFFMLSTNLFWLTGELPSVDDLEDPKQNQASELYTSDGVIFGKFFNENRVPVKDFKELSPHLVNALIATEDERFYQHSGVDIQALFGVLKGILTGNDDRGGGSTITQQLAKNLYKTRAKSSRGLLGRLPIIGKINYKFKEWITAIKIESQYSKPEIIMWYLNTVDFGSNAFGIRTASNTYFGVRPDSLTIEEAAVLVGIQKATTTYNPKINPEKSRERRNTVLRRLVKSKYLSQSEYDSLSEIPINMAKFKVETPYQGSGNYFKNEVVKFIRSHTKEIGDDIDLYNDGLKIYTTIDSRLQTYAESSMSEKMRGLQKSFNAHWGSQNPWTDNDGAEIVGFIDTVAKRTDYYKYLAKKYKETPDSIRYYMNKPKKMRVFSWDKNGEVLKTMSAMDSIVYYKKLLQAGLMSMDPFTGHVKAWVGGLDYEYFKYDHVKQGRRQPGSTFKPILYASAIDGPANLTPCEEMKDQPFSLKYREDKEDKVWSPKNADGRFTHNTYTLRKAMAKSVNSVAAALTHKIGEYVVDDPEKDEKMKRRGPDMEKQWQMEKGATTVMNYARKLGITAPMEAVPSIGLGAFDVSLYEMVAAYSVFLNGGNYTEPVVVTRIEDKNGKLLFEYTPKTRPAISRESAFLMIYMLRGGVEENGGTSKGLFNYDLFPNFKCQMAGKTGTTSNYSDAWYMGLSRDLVTGVWVGGDDRSIHFRGAAGEGSRMALPIFGRYMELVFKDKDLPFKPGPFPKATFTINKPWDDCSKDKNKNGGSKKSSSDGDSLSGTKSEEETDGNSPADTTGN